MKKYNKIKITYIICLLFAALVGPLQAAQPDRTAKDDDYKPILNLFEIKGLGLKIIEYVGFERKDGYAALRWSIGFGYLDCAKYIQQKDNSNTVLLSSAYNGHLACVKWLVQEGADINATMNGYTALLFSAYHGDLDCLKFLLQQGANVHAKNDDGYTALLLSAQEGHIDCVKWLVQEGADINIRNKLGSTALLLSAYKGHLDCLKFLVQQGADIHTSNETGKTALLASAQQGHLDCLKFLVRQGADINIQDCCGMTVLTYSYFMDDKSFQNYLEKQKKETKKLKKAQRVILQWKKKMISLKNIVKPKNKK